MASYDDVAALIDDWMDYYNSDRGQWELLKLTPSEFYQYLQTGVYPLPLYGKKPESSPRGSAPAPEV